MIYQEITAVEKPKNFNPTPADRSTSTVTTTRTLSNRTMVETTKTCVKCHEKKPMNEFLDHRYKSIKYGSTCDECKKLKKASKQNDEEDQVDGGSNTHKEEDPDTGAVVLGSADHVAAELEVEVAGGDDPTMRSRSVSMEGSSIIVGGAPDPSEGPPRPEGIPPSEDQPPDGTPEPMVQGGDISYANDLLARVRDFALNNQRHLLIGVVAVVLFLLWKSGCFSSHSTAPSGSLPPAPSTPACPCSSTMPKRRWGKFEE